MIRVRPARSPKRLLPSLGALVALALSCSSSEELQNSESSTPSHPDLFSETVVCADSGDAVVAGHMAEELARLRADRYAYDPRDGVRSVRRYREAEACYRDGGASQSASRVHRLAQALILRVNMDYAATRLNLENALTQRRWSSALGETQRLLLLTHHLGRHEYVEWLENMLGKLASRASKES